MIEEGQRVSWARRIARAAFMLVFNALLWLVIPMYIAGYLSSVPSYPLTNSVVSSFGAVIIALQVSGALAEGSAAAVPLLSGSYLAEAYFIWVATDGGRVAVAVSGLQIGLAFQPLLFLLVLPSLFSAVKAPLTFLLERSDAAGPSSDRV